HILRYQKRRIEQVDPLASHQDHIREHRTEITADGMGETVFQISVADIGRKIPDDHSVVLFHHFVDLFFARIDVHFTADIIFVPAGIHLMYQVARIPVSIDHQKPSRLVRLRVNKSGTEAPYHNDHEPNVSHLYHGSRIQEPPVDQCDLKISHHIGTDRRQDHGITYIDPLQVTYAQSSVKSRNQHIDQRINRDQHPVTLPPEGFKDQPSVKIIPDIGKNCCLSNYCETCQTENNKFLKIL